MMLTKGDVVAGSDTLPGRTGQDGLRRYQTSGKPMETAAPTSTHTIHGRARRHSGGP